MLPVIRSSTSGACPEIGRSAKSRHASTCKDGSIVYQFHARDLHLVLGAANGKAIRFNVMVDGKPPDGAIRNWQEHTGGTARHAAGGREFDEPRTDTNAEPDYT
jgi:hypothetical protein